LTSICMQNWLVPPVTRYKPPLYICIYLYLFYLNIFIDTYSYFHMPKPYNSGKMIITTSARDISYGNLHGIHCERVFWGPIYIHTYIPTYIHTYTHTTYIPIYLHTYRQTHTYIFNEQFLFRLFLYGIILPGYRRITMRNKANQDDSWKVSSNFLQVAQAYSPMP